MNLLNYMGNTPLVKIKNLTQELNGNVYIKLEGFNPGGSIKSRVALEMVLDAERKGILVPGKKCRLIEGTGGNTGIGLAQICLIRGYELSLVIPDNYSIDKINNLKAYGAKVILSNSSTGNDSHVIEVKRQLKEQPDLINLNQLSNPSNPDAHYKYTGKEILSCLDKIDIFVAGVGSGGSITGIGEAIKERFPRCLVIAVQPFGCNILKGTAIKHGIQGLAIGMVPDNFNTEIVDEVIAITEDEAYEYMRLALRYEGLQIGISSGANLCAAIMLANRYSNASIVTLSPDSSNNYDRSIFSCLYSS